MDKKDYKNVRELLHHIQINLSVPKKHYNAFGGYPFRKAEDIMDAVKLLLPVGATVILSDTAISVGKYNYVQAEAELTYAEQSIVAKGWAREADTQKGMQDAQLTGSTSSYARKYAMSGLFLIDDGIDSDATSKEAKESKIPANIDTKKKPTPKEFTDSYIAKINACLDIQAIQIVESKYYSSLQKLQKEEPALGQKAIEATNKKTQDLWAKNG